VGAAGDGPFDADRRIFDNQGVGDVGAELVGSKQIEVRRRLGPADMFAAAVDVLAEALAKAQIVEVPGDPPSHCRRGDGDREVEWQRIDERSRPGHLGNSVAEEFQPPLHPGFAEPSGQNAAGPAFDGRFEWHASKTHELVDRVLGPGRVAGRRQIFGDEAIAGPFAIDEHAVEIE